MRSPPDRGQAAEPTGVSGSPGRAGGGFSVDPGVALFLACAVFALGFSPPAFVGGGDPDPPTAEARSLMAAYMLHFARFATWPDPDPPPQPHQPKPPLVVGVLGPDPFGGRLEAVFQGETFSGRRAVVRRLQSESEAAGCQLLFIPRSEARRLPALLAALRDRPVLTVSDTPGFLASGGLVAFREDRGKLVFDIDAEGAKRCKIVLSARLLRLAGNLRKEPVEAP